MVQAQVQAYEIDKRKKPENIQALIVEGYLNEGENTCPNGAEISISVDGKVSAEGLAATE